MVCMSHQMDTVITPSLPPWPAPRPLLITNNYTTLFHTANNSEQPNLLLLAPIRVQCAKSIDLVGFLMDGTINQPSFHR